MRLRRGLRCWCCFAMLSMGLLGFIDDFAKVRKKQSEGLTVKGKFIGQFILATIYAVLALILPTNSGFPQCPGRHELH